MKRFAWTLAAIITFLIILALAFLLLWSPGKASPYRDEQGNTLENSVSEVTFVEINGIDQGVIIKGEDAGNPVLLFLHGGPGSPEYPMFHGEDIGMEALFTVCWWDQRGAGLSYSRSIPDETMTTDQLVEDTAEVARYLIQRFGVEKVYLMGHSWGSYLGMYAIQAYPELFHAYVGVGQVSDQLQSELLAYDYMLEKARESGDTSLEKKLLERRPTDAASLDTAYMAVRTEGMNKYGIGLRHENPSMWRDAYLPVLMCREYTLGQKLNYLRGLSYSQEMLWDTITEDSLLTSIPSVDVPVYIMHGLYDYQVSYALAKDYFDALQAPEKLFFTFEKSAHSPMVEEPEKFTEILRTVVLDGDR